MIVTHECVTASVREVDEDLICRFEVYAIHTETGAWFPVAYYSDWGDADRHAAAIRHGLFYGRKGGAT